ncbi:MAG: hypothetical protein AAF517_18660 [Planctomycetota bacterium]
MNSSESIFFEESSVRAEDFLHELNDPSLVQPAELDPELRERLRQTQVEKLRVNVLTLRRKQSEFHRKMEEYIANLEGLIAKIEKRDGPGENPSDVGGSTFVRCTQCSSERTFTDFRVIFARESDEAMDSPTQCYVSEAGAIKKGLFACRSCGSSFLTIQTNSGT